MYEYNPQYGDMISSQDAEVLRQLEYDDKQKQMQAQIDRINEKYNLSDLVAPQQVAAMQPPTGENYSTMREAFDPRTYGFGPESGASLQMPQGSDPNKIINRDEYFKPGGEYWGNTPQGTVAPSRVPQGAKSGTLSSLSMTAQDAERDAIARTEAINAGREYRTPIPEELKTSLMSQAGGQTLLPGQLRQLEDMFKPVYKNITDPQGNVLGTTFDEKATEAQRMKAFEIARGISDEALKRRKATADTLKAEMDLRPKAEKVDETSEQKNYRFAMSLPENMRQPFLEKLGMSRKPEKDADAKRASQMEGIGDVISQARAILTNKAPGQVSTPTQSGLGSIADTAAGWFGMSPSGASEADQLRVLGGVLTSKMPRMEGPQSEYDVKLYQEMAGKIGDSSVPIDRRVKALEQVQSLWKKYDKPGDGQGDSGASQQQSSQYVETRQTKAGLVGKKADGTLELIRR